MSQYGYRELKTRLLTVAEFQRRHSDLYATEAALRWHIQQREHNGMNDAGVVVRTRGGLRIDEKAFLEWYMRSPAKRSTQHEPDSKTAVA